MVAQPAAATAPLEQKEGKEERMERRMRIQEVFRAGTEGNFLVCRFEKTLQFQRFPAVSVPTPGWQVEIDSKTGRSKKSAVSKKPAGLASKKLPSEQPTSQATTCPSASVYYASMHVAPPRRPDTIPIWTRFHRSSGRASRWEGIEE